MRLFAALGLIGTWNAAASLGGPLVLTVSCTLAAAALGAWAIAVPRE